MTQALLVIALIAALFRPSAGVWSAPAQDGPPPAPKPEDPAPPKPVPPQPAPDEVKPQPKPEVDGPKPPNAETKPTSNPPEAKPTPIPSDAKPTSIPSDAKPTEPKPADAPKPEAAPSTAPQTGVDPAPAKDLSGQAPRPLADQVALHEQPSASVAPAVPSQSLEAALATASSSTRPPLRFDATRPLDAGAYAALVERLVLEYPDLLRAQSLGRSRTGRDVWLLTASDLAAGDPARKPALLVCGELPSPAATPHPDRAARFAASGATSDASGTSVAGPEAALFVLARVLLASRTQPELVELLRQCTLYVLPAIDPELSSPAPSDGADPAARACRVDRNFPVDWQPWGTEPGVQGPYPLSEPESQAVALFLAQRSNVSAALVLARDGRSFLAAPARLESADAQRDEAHCERVCAMVAAAAQGTSAAQNDSAPANGPSDGVAPGVLHPPASIVRHGGDFTSFCEELVGLSVFAAAPWFGASLETPIGPAPAGFETGAMLVEKLLKALPRLATDAPRVERLRNNLWMIDVGVHNVGILPSLGERSRARGAGPSIWLETRQAKLVAVAVRRASDPSYEALRPNAGGVQIGHLDGEEQLSLRILVEAPEGTTVELSFDSQRAGRKELKVPLQ